MQEESAPGFFGEAQDCFCRAYAPHSEAVRDMSWRIQEMKH